MTVTMLNYLVFYEGVLLLIYVAVVFLFTLLFLEGDWRSKLLVSVLYLVCIVFISSTVTGLVTYLAGIPLQQVYTTSGWYRFVTVMLVQILIVYCYAMLLRLFKKTAISFRLTEWLVLLSVFVLTFAAILCVHLVRLYTVLSGNAVALLMVADVCLIGINPAVFYLISRLSQKNEQLRIQEAENQQLVLHTAYVGEVQKQAEALRHIRHDWKQHLSVLQVLLSERQYEKATQYLAEYEQTALWVGNIASVGQPMLDALLTVKFTVARDADIQTKLCYNAAFDAYSDLQLCNLLGNLLDNAIEACQQSKLDVREISVSIAGDKERLMIRVANTTSHPVLPENPQLTTRKPEKATHGYGMKTIRRIAQLYHGTVDCYDLDGMFCVQVILFA